VDEGEFLIPLGSESAVDAEYPGDNCCLLQDVVERSRQKFGMLQGYGDAVLRAEALEEQRVKARKHSAMLQSKLDGTFAQYHNEVQDMRRAMSWCGRTSRFAPQQEQRYAAVLLSTHWKYFLVV
jgi:hypothetical protein